MDLLGLLYMVLLFIACFFTVHFVKLAFIGFKSIIKKPRTEQKEEKKEPQQQPQPVYYIVEKKRSRKATYSQPKEIQFKDGK